MAVPRVLIDRYRRLFRFYDRDGDGLLVLEQDFAPVARTIHARWQGRIPPFADLLELLLSTYAHEQQRRDSDGDGTVNCEEFVDSHQGVLAA